MGGNTILNIRDLSIEFNTNLGRRRVVNGINLSLDKGDLFALVGESGSGKSVTAMSIMRLINKNIISYPSGEILFHNSEIGKDEDILSLGEVELNSIRGKHIGMIFQEPMSALNPLHKIGKQIAESISIHYSKDVLNSVNSKELSKEQYIKNRVLELLELVGLEHFKNRLDAYPHQLSGGERQRVVIAMAIANNPDILIADEPTTALDVSLQKQIIQLIQRLQKQLNMTVLLISHDLRLVSKVANKVAVMRCGEIVEKGRTSDVFMNPQHEYTQKLISSEPKGCAIELDRCNAPTVLSCDNLSVSFAIKKSFLGKVLEYKHAVASSSISLLRGETLGIVGESGSGKTTLGLALLRLVASKGDIFFMGNKISALNSDKMRPFRKEMQFIFQDPFASLNPRFTIGDIVGEGLRIHEPDLSDEEYRNRVDNILREVGIEGRDIQNRYPHEFSGGQRQRINIARAMVLRPKLVVLDEPTSALDLSLQSQIIDMLKKLQEKYRTSYLFITHDLRVIKAISHRIIVIKDGKIVEENYTDRIFSSPQHEYTKTLIEASF